jgi:hypothetical protein
MWKCENEKKSVMVASSNDTEVMQVRPDSTSNR